MLNAYDHGNGKDPETLVSFKKKTYNVQQTRKAKNLKYIDFSYHIMYQKINKIESK